MKAIKPTWLALGLATLALNAAADPIAERQELMEQTRDALKPMVGMVKGEADFDAATVASGFETMRHTAEAAGALFPAGSETGGDTEAKSTIWSDRAGFDQALADFAAAVDAAIAAAPKSVEELKPVLSDVTKTCKGCHDGYRIDDH